MATKKTTAKKTAAKKTKKSVKKAVAKTATKKAASKKVVKKAAKKVIKKTVGKTGGKTVVFSFHSPASGALEVAGDFNDWNPAKGRMKKDREGIWTLKLSLAAGKYQYKLVFDGDSWELDPNAPQVMGEYGPNNLLVVR